MYDSDHAANVKTVTNNNAVITSAYKKYTENQMKYAVQSTNKQCFPEYVMDDPAGQCFDEDEIEGIKITHKSYYKINTVTHEVKLKLDSSGYSSRLEVNMYPLKTGQYSVVF